MLRQRMAEDLKLRGLAPITVASYLRYAQRFAEHYAPRSPLRLGEREVKDFLLHMVEEKGVSPSTHVVCLAGIKFLYEVTLRKPEVVEKIPYPKRPVSIPDVLSGSEVERLLGCVTSIRMRLVCTTMYATGLRIAEACQLRPGDVDAQRRLIHVRRGGFADDVSSPHAIDLQGSSDNTISRFKVVDTEDTGYSVALEGYTESTFGIALTSDDNVIEYGRTIDQRDPPTSLAVGIVSGCQDNIVRHNRANVGNYFGDPSTVDEDNQ